MAQARTHVAPGATVTIEIPEDEEQARTLMILAGSSQQAKDLLRSIATEFRTLADKASALRLTHDSLLNMRQAMRGDCADVNPLRKPRTTSGDSDSAETTEGE